MLTEKQVLEIKEHLNNAQNPIFFFDNDPDGLCSFLLLQRYIERGRGIPIKSFPDLIEDYFRRVVELEADYIFILDKPLVSKEFFQKAHESNIPVVWIDHHLIDFEKIPEFVNYYNPLQNKSKTEEPVTVLCCQISQKKEDLWLGVVGSVSDHFTPDFYKKFKKEYYELSISREDPFDILYSSEIGKIARIFSFALKDTTTNVVKMMKFLMKVKGPYDVLKESSDNKSIHHRYKTLNEKYQRLLKKASLEGEKKEKLLFFKYAGDLSISSDLANELSYLFPEKIIAVVYVRGAKVNISMRGKKVRDILAKSIKDLKNATGGGHEEAVGGQVQMDDLEKFKKNLENLVTK